MNEFLWYIILLIIVLLTAYWYLTVPKNLPPGSAGIPILGYLPFLEANIHKSFAQLGKKFGKVFHLYLGNRLVIVLNDYEAVKEAFILQGEIFSGRPHDVLFKESEHDNCGIIATDGEFWKTHRRFILTNLRDYGVGKLTLEPQILDEIQHFIKEIKNKNEKPFPIKDLLTISIANNIQILLTGKRFEYDNPFFTKLQGLFKRFGELSNTSTLLMFFPWLKHLPSTDIIFKRKAGRIVIKEFINLVESLLEDVKKTFKDGERDNYAQAYLTEQKSRQKINPADTVFKDLSLVHNTRDLFAAGTNSSASTLLWIILYLTNYPEIQKKIQKEIEEVIGDREPSFNDRTNMPYTEATIAEVHRIVSHVPMGIAHRNMKETTLFNHRIPNNTLIFCNIWNIHHDPKLWGDPENFRPDRFINEDGHVFKPEYLMPFSIGKRACVGEPLARMELFLYLVSLLQNFNFVPPDGICPSLDSKPGFTLQPKSLIVCANQRKH